MSLLKGSAPRFQRPMATWELETNKGSSTMGVGGVERRGCLAHWVEKRKAGSTPHTLHTKQTPQLRPKCKRKKYEDNRSGVKLFFNLCLRICLFIFFRQREEGGERKRERETSYEKH